MKFSLKVFIFLILVASGYALAANGVFAAAPSLEDILYIIPGSVFKLNEYIESFDFSLGFKDDPKTIPEIADSIPKTEDEARGFFWRVWDNLIGLILAIWEFFKWFYQGFINWIASILGFTKPF